MLIRAYKAYNNILYDLNAKNVSKIINSNNTLEQKNTDLLNLFEKEYHKDILDSQKFGPSKYRKIRLMRTLSLFKKLHYTNILKLTERGNILNSCYPDIVALMLTDDSFKYNIKRWKINEIAHYESNIISELIFTQINSFDADDLIKHIINMIKSVQVKLNTMGNTNRIPKKSTPQRIQTLMCCACYYCIKNYNLDANQLDDLLIKANYFSNDTLYRTSILKIFMKNALNMNVESLIHIIKKLDNKISFYSNKLLITNKETPCSEEFYAFPWDNNNIYREYVIYPFNIILKLFLEYNAHNSLNYYETLKLYISIIPSESMRTIDKIYYNDIYRIIIDDPEILQIHHPKDIIHIFKYIIKYPQTQQCVEEIIKIFNVLDDDYIIDICTTAINNENIYSFDFYGACDLLKSKNNKHILQQFCMHHGILIAHSEEHETQFTN